MPHLPIDIDSRRAIWTRIALIVLVTAVAYGPAYHADYIWDDDDYIVHNEVLKSFDGLFRIWFEPTSIPQYYPLVHTSFWIDYRLWGLDPFGYHVVNVLLHATGASLLLMVLRRLGVPGALVAALVFAVHPVQVESVAWITERKNVLSGVFYLAALLVWIRWRPPSGLPGSGGMRGYWLAFALFVCALLSKTVTCSLPAAILLITWWRKGRIERRDAVLTLPLFAVGVIFALTTAWLEAVHVKAAGIAWEYTAVDRVLIAGRALWFYVGSLIAPFDLSFNYVKWQIDAADGIAYAYPIGALAVLAMAWWCRGRIGRGPLVAFLFFGGTLLPALGFVNVYPMRYSFVADHFQYLACLGVIVLVCAVVAHALRDRRVVGAIAGAVLITVLAILTWRQCYAYDGLVALWTDTLRKNPTSTLALTNLGKIHLDQNRPDEALPLLERALALDQAMYEAHANVGVICMQRGDYEAARTHFERVVELEPGQAAGYNNLAALIALRGEPARALPLAQKAIEIAPDDVDSNGTIASIYADLDRRKEALEHLQRALGSPLRRPVTFVSSAGTLDKLGMDQKAVEVLVALLRGVPGHERGREALVALFRRQAAAADESGAQVVARVEAGCRLIDAQVPDLMTALAASFRDSGRGEVADVLAARAAVLRRH